MTTTTERPTLRQDERGIALAIAIFALVIIATLVTGVFFMARLEQRSGNNALWSTQAQEAADAGLNATLAAWDGAYNSLAAGAAQTLATQVLPGNTSRYTATVRKISNQIFLVESRGERVQQGGGVLSGTTVGRIVKMITPDVNINAAVTANGPVTLQGNLTVDGRDTDPPNWPACTTKDTVAGVRTSQSIKAGGSYSAYGDPPLVANDGDKYAEIKNPYDAFYAMANKIHNGDWSSSNSPRPVTEVVSGVTVCNRTDARNWGESYRSPTAGTIGQCTGYSPIVSIRGSGESRITGGRGQGILLVAGDLQMAGGFEWVGIIIVLGDVRTTGMGAKITGAMLALNDATSDITYIGGTPVFTYSSCAIATALAQTAYARPLAERSWLQLY